MERTSFPILGRRGAHPPPRLPSRLTTLSSPNWVSDPRDIGNRVATSGPPPPPPPASNALAGRGGGVAATPLGRGALLHPTATCSGGCPCRHRDRDDLAGSAPPLFRPRPSYTPLQRQRFRYPPVVSRDGPYPCCCAQRCVPVTARGAVRPPPIGDLPSWVWFFHAFAVPPPPPPPSDALPLGDCRCRCDG